MSVPTPVWSRPDDAVRQAQLDAMKRRATGLLALAAAVFGAATAFEGRYPWLGYVRATAEASLVGGLADWFAVTALFRRPLGLPIPHTAIVATRKERIGRILGTFVQNHFLSRDVIATKLQTLGLARRAARWLSQPENARRVAQQVASGVAKTLEALPDDEMRRLVHEVVTARLRTLRVAPTLGKTLSLVLAGDAHQELLSEAVRLTAQAVHDNRDVIRRQVRAESPWWVPGAVDDKIYEKIVGAIELLLRRIARRQRCVARGDRLPRHRSDGVGRRAIPPGDRRLHRPDRRRLGPAGHVAAVRIGGRTRLAIRPHQRDAGGRAGRPDDLYRVPPVLALGRFPLWLASPSPHCWSRLRSRPRTRRSTRSAATSPRSTRGIAQPISHTTCTPRPSPASGRTACTRATTTSRAGRATAGRIRSWRPT